MIAIDLGSEILLPAVVTLVGAVVAGLSAAVKSWIENRGARRRAERQIELADQRTKFVGSWVGVSDTLEDAPAPGSPRDRARSELDQAFVDAQRAYDQAKNETSTVFRQFRRLLMLVRRRNPASYVVSGLFLFVATFTWLLVCIPEPSNDEFSIFSAVLISFVTTIVLRCVAELVVNFFEHRRTPDNQTVSDLSAESNVVTITTRAPHGLSPNEMVVVDVTKDVFDGTFTVVSVPTPTSFTVEHAVADTAAADVKGWVCGDGIKMQMKQLLMIDGNHGRAGKVLGGLFLVWVLYSSMSMVYAMTTELDTDDYPSCNGMLYVGSYFGDNDLPKFLDERGEPDVALAVEFLEDEVPLWSPEFSGISIVEQIEFADSRDLPDVWTLVDSEGNRYVLDEYGLYYEDASTELHTKTVDDRLEELGDPCDPQEITVHTLSGEWTQRDGPLLFLRFDPSADESDFIEELYEGEGENERKIEAYFGHDGRLIPVCSADGTRIEPCIARANVYYDSGLDYTVSLLFEYALGVITLLIIGRLLLGLVRSWFDRRRRRGAQLATGGAAPT